MKIIDIQPEQLHHTYIISGDRASAFPEIINFIENTCGVRVAGNQDVFVKEYDSFYIDDAREIRDLQQHAAVKDRQFFVLSIKEMTRQAQNAFLKIAEDPTANTCFFILVSNYETLLPTLRSRAVIVENKEEDDSYHETAQEFLASSVSDRLEMVQKLHTADTVDKEKIYQFLSALEGVTVEKRSLHDIYDVKKKMQAQGVSVKTLLEHVSVVLPRSG